MAAPISVECINRGDELPLPQLPSESQEDYLSRKALKPLLEFLAASCLLHRPEDVIGFLQDILRKKAEEQLPLNPENCDYVKEMKNNCSALYQNAMAMIETSTENISIMSNKATQADTALRDMHSLDCPDVMAKIIISSAMKAFDAEQVSIHGVPDANEGPELEQIGISPNAQNNHITPGAGLLGETILSDQIRIIRNTSKEGSYNDDLDRIGGVKLRTLMMAPIVTVNDRILGWLTVANRRGDAVYTEADCDYLQLFTATAAASLVHGFNLRVSEKECSRLQSMMNIVEAINENDCHMGGMNRIPFIMSMYLPKICGAHRCTYFMVDHKRQEILAIQGDYNIKMPMGKGMAGTVATIGEVINVPNAYEDPRFSQDVDKNTGYNTNAMLTMPIKTTSGVIISVVQFINKVVDHLIPPQKTPDLTGVFSAKDESEMTTFLGLLGPLLDLSSMLPRRSNNNDERGQHPQGDCQKTPHNGKIDRKNPLHPQNSIQEGDELNSKD